MNWKNCEGIVRGLIYGAIPAFVWRDSENPTRRVRIVDVPVD